MKNLSLHQFFIIGILFSCVFSGCKTGELENRLDNMERQATAVESDFRAGNYAVADRVFERLASEPTVSSPLYRLDRIPCLILSGRKQEAHSLMQSLRVDLEELYDAESEKKALSKWHGEVNKVFKGAPHEMGAFYALMALSFAEKGEYEDAWRCVQNGLLHDADAREDKYQSDETLLLYLGSIFAAKAGEEDSAEQCRGRLKDALANRGIELAENKKNIKSAYSVLFLEKEQMPNAFIVFWSGTPPQFGRDGKYGEKRTILKGNDSVADFLTVSVDGGKEKIVPEKIGDFNFQATTRGGREMDNILADKADFKQDMKNFQDISVGLSGLCFTAAAAMFDTSEAGLVLSASFFAAGVSFLVLDGVFYCFYDKTDPRSDIRTWKTLPGQLNVLPLRLTPGRHELKIRSRVGGDVMSYSTVSIDVPSDDSMVVAHVPFMDDTIINDTLSLFSKTVEVGNKNAPIDRVLEYPQSDFKGDVSAWYSIFGEDFSMNRINVQCPFLKENLGEAFVRHGYINRWTAGKAIKGECPICPDKTLICLGSNWYVTNTVDGVNVLDTRISVAVRGAANSALGRKAQTGPVKLFYAWSRLETSSADIREVTNDEKATGVKLAVENLFKMPVFREAMKNQNVKVTIKSER